MLGMQCFTKTRPSVSEAAGGKDEPSQLAVLREEIRLLSLERDQANRLRLELGAQNDLLRGELDKALGELEAATRERDLALKRVEELSTGRAQPWWEEEENQAKVPLPTAQPAPAEGEFPPLSELRGSSPPAAFPEGEEGAVSFHLCRELDAVEYRLPEEVAELSHSVNVAYLAPEGKGQETCQGYICSLQREGGKTVLVALYGSHSGRTWIYGSDVEEEREEGYLKAMSAALHFADQVGLIMEPAASSPPSAEEVKGCPVLRRMGA